MKTVEEILRESGLSDEQIKALDAKVTTGLTQVLSTASQTLEAAELAKRANAEIYDTQIAPALDKWANSEANLTAERDYYKTLAEKAKAGGFVAEAAPFKATPAQGADGKFVAGTNPVPGSPGFEKKLTDELGNAFAFAADTQWKYRTLFGTEMPDSPTAIIREASAQRMSPADYAAKKYDFAGKEAAKRAADQKAHDDAIRKETKEASDKEWAEKVGSNPNIRQGRTSEFSIIDKAVKEGARPDPLKMTPEQRRQSTRSAIHKEIAANETVQ